MAEGQIYEEFQPKVRACVRGKIQDPHDAEELVSAVFMKVVKKLDSYDPAKASVSTWVYTVTRNTVTNYFRCRSMVDFENYMVDEAPAELSDDEFDNSGHTLKNVAEMMGMSCINAKVIHKKAMTSLQAFHAADCRMHL